MDLHENRLWSDHKQIWRIKVSGPEGWESQEVVPSASLWLETPVILVLSLVLKVLLDNSLGKLAPCQLLTPLIA